VNPGKPEFTLVGPSFSNFLGKQEIGKSVFLEARSGQKCPQRSGERNVGKARS